MTVYVIEILQGGVWQICRAQVDTEWTRTTALTKLRKIQSSDPDECYRLCEYLAQRSEVIA